MRKRSLLLAAGACLATLTLTISAALADPTGAPTFRELAGGGDGVTNAVGNQLANDIKINGTKVLGSYDSEDLPGQPNPRKITTKATGCDNIDRPDGAVPAIDALVANNPPGCLQFARSGIDDHLARSGQGLTYIPYADDGMTYVTLSQTTVPSSLTIASLKSIYTCGVAGIQPLLPHFGEGTRKFWLEKLGLTDSADFTNLHPCVIDTTGTGPTEENNGTFLTASNQIMPYSSGLWISQVDGAMPDLHGLTSLRRINGVAPLLVNPLSMIRWLFHIVRTNQIGAGTHANQVLVGPNSLVCLDITAITKFGFATIPECGTTTIQTP